MESMIGSRRKIKILVGKDECVEMDEEEAAGILAQEFADYVDHEVLSQWIREHIHRNPGKR